MSILAMYRHGWLDGQKVPRSHQTAHLTLESRFFDRQVASWFLKSQSMLHDSPKNPSICFSSQISCHSPTLIGHNHEIAYSKHVVVNTNASSLGYPKKVFS